MDRVLWELHPRVHNYGVIYRYYPIRIPIHSRGLWKVDRYQCKVAKCTYSKHLLIPLPDRALRHIGRAPMQIYSNSPPICLHNNSTKPLSTLGKSFKREKDRREDYFLETHSVKRSSSRLRVSSGPRLSSLLCDCLGCAVIKILLSDLRMKTGPARRRVFVRKNIEVLIGRRWKL